MRSPATDESWVAIGTVVRPWGIKGALIVDSYSGDLERFGDLLTLRARHPKTGATVNLSVEEFRIHQRRVLLFFSSIHSITEAEALRGWELEVPESEAIELEEDEFFYHDLLGCEVTLPDGSILGTLKEIMETGANDVLVIRNESREFLIPFIEQVVTSIDLEAKKIAIRPIPGMIEEEG